jgi:hypothetical protein
VLENDRALLDELLVQSDAVVWAQQQLA